MRIELIASDRQSEMLAVTPTNRYSCNMLLQLSFQGLESVPGSNRYPQVESLRSWTIRRTDQNCIAGQTRTDNLMTPDHEFFQLKYCYVFNQRTFFKMAPLLHPRGSLFSSFLRYSFYLISNSAGLIILFPLLFFCWQYFFLSCWWLSSPATQPISFSFHPPFFIGHKKSPVIF